MSTKLPRLQSGLPIADDQGRAATPFSRLWDLLCTTLEGALASLTTTIAGVVAAQADATIAIADAATALTTANAAQATATAAQTTANTGVANAATAQAAAVAAQTDIDALEALQFVMVASDADVPNGRVLSGSTGVTIDTASAGLIKVLVNVATALGFTPANKAGDTFSGDVTVPNLISNGTVYAAGGLVTGQTPAATVTASDHSIPINCNGTIFYIRLSTTP